MSAFTVCWKEENRNSANDIHSFMSPNTSVHFGAREISLASEVLHQQDSNGIFFLLYYLSCQKKTSNAQGVQNHVDNTFRQPNLSLFCFKEFFLMTYCFAEDFPHIRRLYFFQQSFFFFAQPTQ